MSKSYDPEHTGLLIVDPYNDFMSVGGKTLRSDQADRRRVRNVRQSPQDYSDRTSARHPGLHRAAPPFARGRFQWLAAHESVPEAGAADKGVRSRFVGWRVPSRIWSAAGDVVIKEHWAQSGFANTDLDAQLKQRGIGKIILVGLIANSCIESTARWGMELGYHVTLVNDATAAFSAEGMQAAAINAPMFAHAILSTRELVEQLEAN